MLINNILTKDNLVRRGWTGNEERHFGGAKESIDHLFFECVVAKLIWHVVTCAFGLPSIPANLSDLMGNWIKPFPGGQRKVVLCGSITICWTIWKARNRACLIKEILMTLIRWCIGFAFILMLGVCCRKPRLRKN